MRTRDGNQLLTLAVDAKDEELVEILSPKTIDNVDSTGYTALYRYSYPLHNGGKKWKSAYR